MVSSSTNLGLSILFLVSTFHFLVTLNKRKIKGMGNCLSKFNDTFFTLHTPPLTSGHLKKVVSGIRKNPAKYFATRVHQKYGYERITKSIKSSLMDVYDRFPSQSFALLDGGAPVIKK